MSWRIPAIGDWSSQAEITLRRGTGGRWVVHFAPQLIDVHLTPGTRLGTTSELAPRAPILDREGRALVQERAVVEVGLNRERTHDIVASSREMASVTGVDPNALLTQLKGAGPHEFVQAVTLRSADYARVEARLRGIAGLETLHATLPLTPTRAFARALLGAVAPASEQQVKDSRGRLAAGELTGQWGLEQQFDARLAGTPTRRVVVRDSASAAIRQTLYTLAGARPQPLRSFLSERTQNAAEQALGTSAQAAALLAVEPSSGDVLAVADRPLESTFDRALTGVYPPGSTFKIITAAALLAHGITPATSVPCPPTLDVDGRSFRNFEGEAAGSPSFAEDFAISCNTAFISLAGRLPAGALSSAARDFGLGVSLATQVPLADSHVPLPAGAVARAESMIGQGRITTSPLAMAGVAATVASGRWHSPRLLDGDPSSRGPALPSAELSTLRALMRRVVSSGTGGALAGVPGGVAGKSGTAEYGSGKPPPTHAWFVAYRGDLAVAVLVEHGSSGGAVAGPIAARFFTSYDTGP